MLSVFFFCVCIAISTSIYQSGPDHNNADSMAGMAEMMVCIILSFFFLGPLATSGLSLYVYYTNYSHRKTTQKQKEKRKNDSVLD